MIGALRDVSADARFLFLIDQLLPTHVVLTLPVNRAAFMAWS